ncbi:hypothetical protein [Vallitalea pronyensis]|nr:hypothetical protein [Vallitalea pronyensis]
MKLKQMLWVQIRVSLDMTYMLTKIQINYGFIEKVKKVKVSLLVSLLNRGGFNFLDKTNIRVDLE